MQTAVLDKLRCDQIETFGQPSAGSGLASANEWMTIDYLVIISQMDFGNSSAMNLVFRTQNIYSGTSELGASFPHIPPLN